MRGCVKATAGEMLAFHNYLYYIGRGGGGNEGILEHSKLLPELFSLVLSVLRKVFCFLVSNFQAPEKCHERRRLQNCYSLGALNATVLLHVVNI